MFAKIKNPLKISGLRELYRGGSLNDYQKISNTTLSLADFNSSFFVKFEKFLSSKENPLNTGRGLLNDTIYKYISTLKVFLGWCADNGHPVHPDASKPR
ncbi:MAG TPA: phage integrase SAM-like domain-containing protein [Aquaticitalea sp.]|nr:phage integrase SAM-like domain-containing protein [Aquaticitalea sp.]